MTKKRVYAKLGRAGLGNELFPYLRAVDASLDTGLPIVAPRWLQPRIGPWLRNERDFRNYWTLFRPSSAREVASQLSLDIIESIVRRFPAFKNLGTSTMFIVGMEEHFSSLRRPGPWYRDYLSERVREGQLSPVFDGSFLSVHVRLGDFARPPEGTKELTQNNIGTPLSWYSEIIEFVKAENPNLAILLSSDGDDEELAPLLAIPGVRRTTARNALDELFMMSRSQGIVGSRSTFSSWGAFLGEVPLLLVAGGNAYPPHSDVWEDISLKARMSWLRAVQSRSQVSQA